MVKILTVGDSLTAGLPGNDPRGKGNRESTYQFWLEKSLNDKGTIVYNFGIPGITSQEIYNHLLSISKDQPYKGSEIVIINGGGNDWTANVRIDTSNLIKNLLDCCNYCLKDKKRVVLTSITPFGDDIVMEQLKEIANKLAGYVKRQKSKTFLFFDWFHTVYDPNTNRLKEEYDSSDGEHLNIDGYRVIGTNMAQMLSK